MKKEDLIKLGLDEETAAKVAAASEEELKNYVDKETYNQKAKELQTAETKYTTDIGNIKRDNAIDMAILKANGKNPKAIKALLEMDKINLKEDGTLEGLDIDALKESDGYLFSTEETVIEGTAFTKGSALAGGMDIVNAQIAKAMGIKE